MNNETLTIINPEILFEPLSTDHFPSTLSREESNSLVNRIQSKMEEKGYGMWGIAIPGVTDFIGFIGLNNEDRSTFPSP